jgi:DNA-binding GntR family transcriptional regulator
MLAGCRSNWLRNVSEQLFQAAERYRHVARIAGKARIQDDEHRQITDAILARDADKAVSLLAAHLRKTSELVKTVLEHGVPSQDGELPARRRRAPRQVE